MLFRTLVAAAIATAGIPAAAQVYYYGQDGSVIADTPQGRWYWPPGSGPGTPPQQLLVLGHRPWEPDRWRDAPGIMATPGQAHGSAGQREVVPPAAEVARREEARRAEARHQFGLVPQVGPDYRVQGLVPPAPSAGYHAQGLVPPLR
jgi:hypothetical protein